MNKDIQKFPVVNTKIKLYDNCYENKIVNMIPIKPPSPRQCEYCKEIKIVRRNSKSNIYNDVLSSVDVCDVCFKKKITNSL